MRMFAPSRFARVLCLILLSSLACFAKDATPNRLPVSLVYSLPAPAAKVLEGFVQEYQASHAYLDITTKNFAQPEELYRALLTGSTVPTLAIMETSWLPTVSQKQALFMPVEVWMPREAFALNWAVKCNCYVPLWTAASVNDKLLGMPFFFTTRALILNTDVLARAKVKALPTTWDQLSALGVKMADPKTGSRAIALSMSVGESLDAAARNLQILTWQFGGEGLSAASAASGDANGKAVTFLKKMLTALAPLDGTMAAGPIAMWVGDVEDYFTLKAQGFPVKVAVMPGATKFDRQTEVQAWSVAMFKTFPDDQLYKVQEFAFFIFDFPQQLRWAEQTPYLAAHCKVFDNPFYRQERQADHNNLRVFLNSIGKARLVDTTPPAREGLKRVSKNLGAVLRGEKSFTDVLNSP